MKQIAIFTTLITGILLLTSSTAFGQQNIDVDTLAEKFFCTCGCNMLLSVCETQMTCSVAKQMKAQLKTMIDEDLDEGEIVNRMKKSYGSQVFAVAPKEGFTLTLWMYPVLGIALGSVVIYAISRRKKGVKWHVNPDDVPELNEEEFAQLEELNLEERAVMRKTVFKYDEILKEKYKESKKKVVK